jgi:hypothetical protein
VSTVAAQRGFGRDALPVCLWQENPYGLVSWWDVEEFSGQALHDAICKLESIRHFWATAQPPGDSLAAKLIGQKLTLTVEDREHAHADLLNVEAKVRKCGLPTAGEAISEFRAILLSWNRPDFSQIDPELVIARIEEIQRAIRREMKSVVFMYVSSDKANWYRQPLSDWDAVIKRWPNTRVDVAESSKCFALDRFAAAIFHILLVAEIGVIKVAELLGVSGDKPGWGSAQRLERILAQSYEKRSPLEQQHSRLLKDIVPMIIAVKDSTRHKISHVDNKLVWLDTDFSPQIASEVISATRGFMRRLAAELP